MAAQLEELREQLARTPAAVVVANHAFGLFELAALHLSLQPPKLDEARLAIDALGALVEGMAGRLGEHEAQLLEGLAQLRMAFVQIKGGPAAPTDRGRAPTSQQRSIAAASQRPRCPATTSKDHAASRPGWSGCRRPAGCSGTGRPRRRLPTTVPRPAASSNASTVPRARSAISGRSWRWAAR